MDGYDAVVRPCARARRSHPMRPCHPPGHQPTIKYFNSQVGSNGRFYTRKTDKRICEELGQVDYMLAYVKDVADLSSSEL